MSTLMAADMEAQPEVLRGLAGRRAEVLERLGRHSGTLRGTIIVARGSSDYAAVFGRYVLEAATGRPVALAAPSLTTLYGVRTDLEGWLAVGVSQSGRTPEIVSVLERYRDAGALTVAVTNEAASDLSGAAHETVELGAGDERAIPATKTFTAQLAAFALIAEAWGTPPWREADWDALPEAVRHVLADPAPAERAAERVGDAAEMVCVARGYLTAVALEAALKLREAAGVMAEGWSAADFRHGPIAAARPGVPALAVSAAGPAAADVDELAATLASGGATVLRLSGGPAADLPFPASPAEPLAAIPAAVRAQQLALAVALRRGADPDSPAGLSKVTPTR
ncbi:MAG TPA: SIS domain-containing protein [Thermoleophilaceae bacterium]|nr:SIS domain-containing protein [Thermoleophilaceae bacterium]